MSMFTIDVGEFAQNLTNLSLSTLLDISDPLFLVRTQTRYFIRSGPDLSPSFFLKDLEKKGLLFEERVSGVMKGNEGATKGGSGGTIQAKTTQSLESKEDLHTLEELMKGPPPPTGVSSSPLAVPASPLKAGMVPTSTTATTTTTKKTAVGSSQPQTMPEQGSEEKVDELEAVLDDILDSM